MPNRKIFSIPIFFSLWLFAFALYAGLRLWMQSSYSLAIISPGAPVLLVTLFIFGFVALDPPALNDGAGRRLLGSYAAFGLLFSGEFLLWMPYPEKQAYLFPGLFLLLAGSAWLVRDALFARGEREFFIKPVYEKWAFGLMVLAGLLVRLWKLGVVPGNWWFDEVNLARAAIEYVLDSGKAPLYVTDVDNPGAYPWVCAAVFRLFGQGVERLRYLAAFYGFLTLFPFYFLARRMLGVLPGLVALLLFCAMRWTLIPQRIAFMSGFGLFWTLCAIYYYWRCLTSKKLIDFAALGVALGMTLHAYTPARLVAPLLLAMSLLEWRRLRDIPLQGWLMFGLAYLAVSGPMLYYIFTHWATYIFHSQQVSIMNDIHKNGLGQLWVSFKAHILMFNFQGDHQARHNLQDWPQLDYLSACLFAPGLLYIHATALKDSRARLLTLWFWIMLCAGIFSLVGAAPQGNRTILVTPVTALASAFFLSRCATGWETCFKKGIPGSFRLGGLILLLAIPAFNFYEVSVHWANHESTWLDFSPEASMTAKRAVAERSDYEIYASPLVRQHPFCGLERFTFLDFFLRLKGRGFQRLRSDSTRILEEGQKGILVIWDETDAEITEAFKKQFPNLTIEVPQEPFKFKAGYLAAEVPMDQIPRFKAGSKKAKPLIYREVGLNWLKD